MNVETLLEAARFIELQELKQKNGATVNHAEEPTRNGHSGSTNHAAAPTTRGSFSTGLHRSSTGSPAVTLYAASAGSSGRSDAGTTSPLVVDEGSDNKRRSGPSLMRSGTREVHNKLEKNRRAHLKECFELLKRQLPAQPDEKKSSNLSILHSALRFIQVLRRRERDYEHEMERLAREKIAFQQRLASLKKELSAQWDHIDFNAILPDQLDNTVPVTYSNSVHNREESGHASDGDELGTSGAVYSSTSSLSSAATASSPTGAHVTPIPAALSVVQQNGTSPILLPGNSSPEAPSSSTDKPPQTTAPTLVHHPTLHLPLSQVMSAQGLVVSPTIQLVAGTQGLRVLQASGDRQLTLLQTSGSDRPLALVQTTATTHLDLTTTGSNVSNRLQEPITTSPALHKVVSGSVALVPASQTNFRAAKGLTLANGLTLGPTAVTLASGKQSVTSDSIRTTGVTHVVPSHTSLSGLAPLTPLVVSQGSQVAHIIAAPSQLNGKVMTTPLLKSVGQVPLVNAQYLSTTLVKPVVVVSTPSSANLPPSSS